MTAAQPAEAQNALSKFDFSSLLAGAAHLRPGEPAIADVGAKSLTFAELDRRVSALAQAWRDLGLRPGQRVLVTASASTIAAIAVLAAARAGLDVVLAPLHLAVQDVAGCARAVRAVALAGEPAVGDLAPIDALFTIAANAPDVRLVCALGEAEIDGAVRLDPASLPINPNAMRDRTAQASILTLDEKAHASVHTQQTLIAAALDLAARAHIGPDNPILSLCAPMSFAGLVCGPLLALLTGARLIYTGLFDAKSFLAAIEDAQPVHLVAPAPMTEKLAEAGLMGRDRIATFIALTRFNVDDRDVEKRAPALPAGPRLPRIVDLYACEERAAIAEPRPADATPQPPAAADHMVHLDDHPILAVRRTERGGGFIGSAVSANNEASP